jgi:capsular polysaccharide transport system permease protein
MDRLERTPFKIQRDVLYALLLLELSSRFGKSRGGFFWVLVEPVAHLLVPVMIFTFVRARLVPGIEYPVFLVYGFLPFLFFRSICLQIIDATNSGQGLLAYRQVQLLDVFIAKTLAHSVIYAVVFSVVLTALGMLGYHVFPLRPIELGGVLVLTIALAFGLGLLFAAIASLIPDARAAIKILFMPLYFASGILFPVTRFPDHWVQLLSINPVLHLVELSRIASVEGYQPMPYTSVVYPLGLALLTLLVGLMLYRLRVLTKVTV